MTGSTSAGGPEDGDGVVQRACIGASPKGAGILGATWAFPPPARPPRFWKSSARKGEGEKAVKQKGGDGLEQAR